MSFVADIVSTAYDAVSGAVGGVINAVEQIPVVGDVVKGGMDVVHGVTDFLGPVGTMAASYFLPGAMGLGNTIAGAEGAIMSAEEITAAMEAGQYSVADIAAATGNSVSAVESVLAGEGGGLGLQVANQAAFSAAGSGIGSSILSGAKTLGSVANIGSNLYQAYKGTQTQTGAQAQTSADPYSPYRADAARQLNQLVANPSSITSSAGYEAGLNSALTGTRRQLAQTGQSMSGMGGYNMALTSGDYFNTQYNQQYNRLAGLSGANQAPYVGQTANAAQQSLKAKSDASSLTYMKDAVGGIQDLMKSYWG